MPSKNPVLKRKYANAARFRRKTVNWAKYMIDQAKSSCQSRQRKGKSCVLRLSDVDVKSMYESQNGRCYFTGIELNTSNPWSIEYVSLDRLDSAGDYEPENCVLVCKWVNFGKNKWGAAEFYGSLLKIDAKQSPASKELG